MDYLPFEDPVEVIIRLYPPDNRKRDIDNHVKSTLDLVSRAGIWVDDSQVDKLTVIRDDVTPGGLIEISIAHCKKESKPENSPQAVPDN